MTAKLRAVRWNDLFGCAFDVKLQLALTILIDTTRRALPRVQNITKRGGAT
jgi:hypothetical protein